MASSSQEPAIQASAGMGQSKFDVWHKEITAQIHDLDEDEDESKSITLPDLVSSHRKFVHHLVNKYEYLTSKSHGQDPNKVLVITKEKKPPGYVDTRNQAAVHEKFVYPNGCTDERLVLQGEPDEHGGRFYQNRYDGKLAYVAAGCHDPVYIGESCVDTEKKPAVEANTAAVESLKGKVDAKTVITHPSAAGLTVTYPSCGCKVLYRTSGEATFITPPAGHPHVNPNDPSWTTDGTVGKGKSKGGKHNRTREEQLSRMLSSLLRHRAHEAGLEVGKDGYAALQHILKLKQFQRYAPTVDEIKAYVESNTKKRFTLIDRAPPNAQYSIFYIKANQGHTLKIVDDDALLTEIKEGELDVCVHGTFERLWLDILEMGLSSMTRNHIHFISKQPNEKVQSGFRTESDFCIFVDANRAIRDGIKFYRSANDVILTRGHDGLLPAEYFDKAVRIGSMQEVWTRSDGFKIPEDDLVKTKREGQRKRDKELAEKQKAEGSPLNASAPAFVPAAADFPPLGATSAQGSSQQSMHFDHMQQGQNFQNQMPHQMQSYQGGYQASPAWVNPDGSAGGVYYDSSGMPEQNFGMSPQSFGKGKAKGKGNGKGKGAPADYSPNQGGYHAPAAKKQARWRKQ